MKVLNYISIIYFNLEKIQELLRTSTFFNNSDKLNRNKNAKENMVRPEIEKELNSDNDEKENKNENGRNYIFIESINIF